MRIICIKEVRLLKIRLKNWALHLRRRSPLPKFLTLGPPGDRNNLIWPLASKGLTPLQYSVACRQLPVEILTNIAAGHLRPILHEP